MRFLFAVVFLAAVSGCSLIEPGASCSAGDVTITVNDTAPVSKDCPLSEVVTYALEDLGGQDVEALVVVSSEDYYQAGRLAGGPDGAPELYFTIPRPEAGQTYRVVDFLTDRQLAEGDPIADIELRSPVMERGNPREITNTVRLDVYTASRAAGTVSTVDGARTVTATFDVEL